MFDLASFVRSFEEKPSNRKVVTYVGLFAAASVGYTMWRWYRWNSSLQVRRNQTLLRHVASSSAEQIVTDTIMLGANPMHHNNLPLHVCVSTIDETTEIVIKALIDHGSRNEGASFTQLDLLISEGWSVPKKFLPGLCDGISQTPLHRLLRSARRHYETDPIFSLVTMEKCLKELIRCGDVNELDSLGMAPIHVSVVSTKQKSERFGHVALGVLLTLSAIEVNKTVTHSGRTILHILCERVATTSDPVILLSTIEMVLAQTKLHVNAEDKQGDTPLHLLVMGFVSVVTPPATESQEDFKARWNALHALLKRGANPMLPNRKNVQPYQIASEAHLTDLCSVLRSSTEKEKNLLRDMEVIDEGDLA